MSSGGFELVKNEVPSPDEARRLWKEGKTLEDWRQEQAAKKKAERKSNRK